MGHSNPKWSLTLLPLLCLTTKHAKAAISPIEPSQANGLSESLSPETALLEAPITPPPIQLDEPSTVGFAPIESQAAPMVASISTNESAIAVATSVAPEPIAPELIAPELIAPEPIAPESRNPAISNPGYFETSDTLESPEALETPDYFETPDALAGPEPLGTPSIVAPPEDSSALESSIDETTASEFNRVTESSPQVEDQILPIDNTTQNPVNIEGGPIEVAHSTVTESISPAAIAPAPPANHSAPSLPRIIESAPQQLAQIIPTDDATQTQVNIEGEAINITGGTQSNNNLFHRFDSFNVESGQIADFVTTPEIQSVVGQVVGGDPSHINGLIQSTGSTADVYLVNPAGILFGHDAQLNLTGSFTATTADQIHFGTGVLDVVATEDYSQLAGQPEVFAFRTDDPGSILNQGDLTVNAGQSIQLIGGEVINTGRLTAPEGEISLIAVPGENLVRLGHANSLLTVEIEPAPIFSNGSAAPSTLAELLTGESGSNASDLIVNADGSVTLAGSDQAIDATAGTLLASGEINVSSIGQSETGGDINLLGNEVQIMNGQLLATGDTGGGTIRIGGDYQGQGAIPTANNVQIDQESTIQADALNTGNGGQVIIWANETARFSGMITARGGAQSGNGGFVETSGKERLQVGNSAQVDTTALAGEVGQWLLDPANLTVANIGGDITPATLVTNLQTSDQILMATSQLTISDPIDATGNTAAAGIGNLTLDAPTVNLNQRVSLQTGRTLNGGAATTTVNVGTNGSITNGVDVVAAGGTVNLAATTYREGTEITIDQTVTLQGQGAANTIISGDAAGDGNGVGNQADNHRVINISATANNVNISGVTISDGIQTISGISLGAGLGNMGSNVLISDSTFINNQVIGSDRDGGAIHNQGSLTLLRNTLSQNRANGDGGAIDIRTGSVNIIDSILSNNQAEIGHGGAIDVDPTGTLTITNSSITNNIAATDGGGIYSQGLVSMTNSTVTNNNAQTGGGLHNNGGTLTITTSQIVGNQSTAPVSGINIVGGGGILNSNGGTLTLGQSEVRNNSSVDLGGGILNVSDGTVTTAQISQSTISGNQAGNRGGGIQSAQQGVGDSVLSVADSTISGNSTGLYGGGLRVVGTTTLQNVTITANSSGLSGGGLSENSLTAQRPILMNTLIAGNTALANPDVEGHFTDQGNNLIGDATGSTGFSLSSLIGTGTNPINPLLSPLANNGGPTQTHALQAGSPAINAGNPLTFTVDQRGQIIVGIRDIGAFERDTIDIIPSVPSPPITEPIDPLVDTIQGNPHETETQPLDSRRDFSFFDELAFQALERSFTEEYAQYWQLEAQPQTTLEDVQTLLQQAQANYATQAAVIYATFIPPDSPNLTTENAYGSAIAHRLLNNQTDIDQDQLLLVLVPTEGEPVQQLINVTREEITQQAKLFRLAVSDPEDEESYRPLARQMYHWLLAPLAEEIQHRGIENLMYALDSGLRTIPISAMMDDDSYVIERYGVSIIPSVGLLQLDMATQAPGQRTLAAGADIFTDLEALPAVPVELGIIQQISAKNQILLNESFTLNNLTKIQAQTQPEMLHLATHAQFNAGDPNSSYIQFWDNQLTFSDIQTLNLQDLELLILSACETALSSSEAELGFAGLATATGVETSIGSLWTVSDIGTLSLMSALYGQMTHTSLRVEALRQAQLSLLTGNTRIENNRLITQNETIVLPEELRVNNHENFEHPFYWSGFTLVGNPWW